jgi:2-amino-4-hydroxy-6-hydroxymethyldihydropteridine diphosphokinase
VTQAAKTAVRAWIGVGANLGNAEDNVRLALQRLGDMPSTKLEAASSLFRSAPLEASGEDYVNAVARISTSLPAPDLLEQLHGIERAFGRERTYRNAPRTMDLDILLYGDATIDADDLTVPHPRMTERAFVLLPLLQIDPFIAIPGKGPAHAFVPAVAGQPIQRIATSPVQHQ